MLLKTGMTDLLGIQFPLLMAPMFLVSNEAMMQSAIRNGIAGAFPTLNYRSEQELIDVIKNLHSYRDKNNFNSGIFGVNLIVQRSNPFYERHLQICIAEKVPFYITSLGNPKEVIEQAHAYGAKVFSDVTNLEHAKKSFSLGCDGFIAVGQGAGGHAGPFPLQILVQALNKNFPTLPVIAAGGIANGAGILSTIAAGAAGVSVGTRFIASKEAKVSDAYKNAVVDSDMDDIVMTERLSGTPCTIINTPFAEKMGYKQNFFERWMSKNPRTKKYFKMMVQAKGFKRLEDAVKPGNYNNLWCAGQSVELIDDILPCDEIIKRLMSETFEAKEKLVKQFENK